MADEKSNDEQIRQWAITQVIHHHKGTGVAMKQMIVEAEALITYVKSGKAE